MHQSRCSLVALLSLTALSLGVGCSETEGPEREVASGSITFDGQPVMAGMIRFVPMSGPPVQAEIIDGKYHADYKGGVVVGPSKVEIDGFRATGKKVQISPDVSEPEMVRFIPEKFNEKSELTVEITKGAPNTHDFILTP